MKTTIFALLFVLTAAVSFAQSADARLTEDRDDVEFCDSRGEVKAKSGWGGSAGTPKGIESVRATLAKRGAAAGGNVVFIDEIATGFATSGRGTAYFCSADALAKQQAKTAEIVKKASTPITCTAGIECELRWARVTQWLLDNSHWKLRNVTDTLITTEGPMETVRPAYEVTRMPAGDGKTYRITLRAFCGVEGVCDKLIRNLRASFYDAITAPNEAAPATTTQ